VLSRYTDVLQSNLALMSSTHLDCILVFRANHMQTSLFSTFLALVDSFKNQIRQFRLINRNHFHWKTTLFASHHARKGFLADLTLKFGEIVGNDHSSHFFFHFTIYPHFEAQNVNAFARTLALAWRNKEVLGRAIVAKAKLASSSDVFVCLVDPVELAKKKFTFLLCFSGIAAQLHHPVLHSSQFYDISQCCVTDDLHRGNPSLRWFPL